MSVICQMRLKRKKEELLEEFDKMPSHPTSKKAQSYTVMGVLKDTAPHMTAFPKSPLLNHFSLFDLD